MKNGDSKEAEREAWKAQNPKSAFFGSTERKSARGQSSPPKYGPKVNKWKHNKSQLSITQRSIEVKEWHGFANMMISVFFFFCPLKIWQLWAICSKSILCGCALPFYFSPSGQN
jgi:hypothetical protein